MPGSRPGRRRPGSRRRVGGRRVPRGRAATWRPTRRSAARRGCAARIARDRRRSRGRGSSSSPGEVSRFGQCGGAGGPRCGEHNNASGSGLRHLRGALRKTRTKVRGGACGTLSTACARIGAQVAPVSCLRDEADLPAQEAQARPHPWLSCPHEHPRGSRRAQASPGQGPQAPDRLAGMAQKRRRLSRSAEFERVYRQGRSKGNRFLVLYAFPREEDAPREDEGPRLGLSVSRRVGGAVDRNRVKRVLREAFWAEAERLPGGSDYVVVARPDARELAAREGLDGVRTALSELVDGLGGAAP